MWVWVWHENHSTCHFPLTFFKTTRHVPALSFLACVRLFCVVVSTRWFVCAFLSFHTPPSHPQTLTSVLLLVVAWRAWLWLALPWLGLRSDWGTYSNSFYNKMIWPHAWTFTPTSWLVMYLKNQGEWYCMNDGTVTKFDRGPSASREAYNLFYEKVEIMWVQMCVRSTLARSSQLCGSWAGSLIICFFFFFKVEMMYIDWQQK